MFYDDWSRSFKTRLDKDSRTIHYTPGGKLATIPNPPSPLRTGYTPVVPDCDKITLPKGGSGISCVNPYTDEWVQDKMLSANKNLIAAILYDFDCPKCGASHVRLCLKSNDSGYYVACASTDCGFKTDVRESLKDTLLVFFKRYIHERRLVDV